LDKKKARKYYKLIISIAGIIGWIIGFFQQSFLATTIIIGVATLVCCMICIPPWPHFRQNQINFLSSIEPPSLDKSTTKKKDESCNHVFVDLYKRYLINKTTRLIFEYKLDK